MTLEEQEDVPVTVSESAEVEPQEQHQEEQKMVPLAALQAERRKRQELEARAKVYEELMSKNPKAEPEEEEDPEALVTKGAFNQEKALTKREILEQVYQDMNPEAVQQINTYLKPILDKKPWLASTLDSAVNRFARAKEIVDDYIHLVEDKPRPKVNDAARMVSNAQKPRSPVEIGKSAQPSGSEYLKSIQGKKEFREYRQKVLSGQV